MTYSTLTALTLAQKEPKACHYKAARVLLYRFLGNHFYTNELQMLFFKNKGSHLFHNIFCSTITVNPYRQGDFSTMKEASWKDRKGKIGQAELGIIHVILLKVSKKLLYQNLQTHWHVICDEIGCRHANLQYQIVRIVFSSKYSAFVYNF